MSEKVYGICENKCLKEVMTGNNFVTISGKIKTPEANSGIFSSELEIDYPEGFNSNNCMVVGIMSRNALKENEWHSPTARGDSLTALTGNYSPVVNLYSDKIWFRAMKYANEAASQTIDFKFTLMKLPEGTT